MPSASVRSISPVSAVLTPATEIHEDALRNKTQRVSFRSASPAVSLDSVERDALVKAPIVEHSKEEHIAPVPSASLSRSSWTFILVGAYAALAIFAWSIICVQTYRPITTSHYNHYIGQRGHKAVQALYEQNQRWLQAARVVQAIVAILTIPMTSAVCSKAAVVFTQHPRLGERLSLRKMMVLSNKGWTDPKLLGKLVLGNFERYGSSFLYLAIGLNVLGSIISPLQSIFLRTSFTKTPTEAKTIWGVTDTMDLLQGGPAGQSEELDINLISILTRSAITSTYITDPQSRLWTRGFTDCNSTTSSLGEGDPQISPCFHGPSTLMNMSQLIDPFLAHLPSGFDTGLISQHLPRMNSSATREKIADADFPAGCEFLPGAFYVNFNHSGVFDSTSSDGSWSLSACMPANLTLSPWRATRDRQDISEQLYLNISTYSMLSGSTPFVGLYRITLNTTLGYFELPNIFNDHVAGPLLEQSPWKDAAPTNRSVQLPINSGQYRRDLGTAGISNSTLLLGSVVNKGPLLTIAMALFGERSFIASRYENPQAFVANFTTPQAKAEIDAGVNRDLFDELCVEQEPMMALLETNRVANRGTFADALYPGCIRGRSNQISNVHLEVEQWIMAFANGFSQDQIVNAFEAAAFLANQAWLLQSSYNPSMWVSYDPGADTEIPVISKAGIVLISVLLFVYLTAMFSMAWYCSRTPTWTSDLDAFAMMRIGAAMSDQIDFACVEDVDKVRILDETPGWIGDLTEDQGAVGELGLGASMPLTRLREVRCYE